MEDIDIEVCYYSLIEFIKKTKGVVYHSLCINILLFFGVDDVI